MTKHSANDNRGASSSFTDMTGNTDIESFAARLFQADVATAQHQSDLLAEAELLFAKMVVAYGDRDAWSTWNNIAKRTKGAPRGARDEAIETFLVSLWAEHRQLHREATRHGAAMAVAKHLRKSLKPEAWKLIGASETAVAKRIVDSAARAE